jgi:hypothetical protein
VAQINENTYRINDLEAIIAGYQLTDLPTGAIATVTDGTALLMPSLKVGIEPAQDLHGYDHPWAEGAGKNKCSYATDYVGTVGYNNLDVLFTMTLKAGTYTFSCKQSTSITTNTRNAIGVKIGSGANQFENTSTNYNPPNLRHAITFTLVKEGVCTFLIWSHTPSESAIYNEWQIEDSTSFTSYAPYSNICPISGWTAANVVVSPTTSAEDGTTYTIEFKDSDNPLTVYGGTLDVTSGELVVDRAMLTINGSVGTISKPNTNRFNIDSLISNYKRSIGYSSGICSLYKSLPQEASNGNFDTAATNFNTCYDLGSQSQTIRIKDTRYDNVNDFSAMLAIEKPTIVYELAEPITYHLAPTQIRTLVGNNNIWADTGDIIEGKYFKSLT